MLGLIAVSKCCCGAASIRMSSPQAKTLLAKFHMPVYHPCLPPGAPGVLGEYSPVSRFRASAAGCFEVQGLMHGDA
jgi:hypothetical protein